MWFPGEQLLSCVWACWGAPLSPVTELWRGVEELVCFLVSLVSECVPSDLCVLEWIWSEGPCGVAGERAQLPRCTLGGSALLEWGAGTDAHAHVYKKYGLTSTNPQTWGAQFSREKQQKTFSRGKKLRLFEEANNKYILFYNEFKQILFQNEQKMKRLPAFWPPEEKIASVLCLRLLTLLQSVPLGMQMHSVHVAFKQKKISMWERWIICRSVCVDTPVLWGAGKGALREEETAVWWRMRDRRWGRGEVDIPNAVVMFWSAQSRRTSSHLRFSDTRRFGPADLSDPGLTRLASQVLPVWIAVYLWRDFCAIIL